MMSQGKGTDQVFQIHKNKQKSNWWFFSCVRWNNFYSGFYFRTESHLMCRRFNAWGKSRLEMLTNLSFFTATLLLLSHTGQALFFAGFCISASLLLICCTESSWHDCSDNLVQSNCFQFQLPPLKEFRGVFIIPPAFPTSPRTRETIQRTDFTLHNKKENCLIPPGQKEN